MVRKTCVGFPQMARVKKKDILSRGNNKSSDKEGWTDVTMIRDYISSGMARLAFLRRCSGKKKCSMVNKCGEMHPIFPFRNLKRIIKGSDKSVRKLRG